MISINDDDDDIDKIEDEDDDDDDSLNLSGFMDDGQSGGTFSRIENK